MAQTVQQSRSSRRALRDLVPVTLATGVAALVVTLLVGGTTAGIRSVLGPDAGSGDLPSLASDALGDDPAAVASGDANAVSVRVRPSLPPPLAVVSVFDLAAPPFAGAAASPVSVRGVSAARTPVISVVLPADPTTPAVAPSAAPSLPVVAPSLGTPKPNPNPNPKPRQTTSRADKAPTVIAAGAGFAPAKDDAEDDAKADAKGEAKAAKGGKATHDAPPDHAVAKGPRGR